MRSNILKESLARLVDSLEQTKPLATFLLGRGITKQTAAANRLGAVPASVDSQWHRHVGMLAIPYLTPAGPVAVKFRQLDADAKPKYLNAPGQGTRMFGVLNLKTSGNTVAVCEGELDAVLLTQLGVPAVGVPGVTHWQKHYPRMFEGFREVLVFADNDERPDPDNEGETINPGRALGDRICRDVPHARIVELPHGMDVTDTFLTHGTARLFRDTPHILG